MLSHVFRIAVREFYYLLRQPTTLLWAFLMPVMFIGFIGSVTGRRGPEPAARDVIGVWVPEDAGFAATALLRHLEAAGYETRRVAGEAELERFTRQLRVPAGLTGRLLERTPSALQFTRRGEPGLGGSFDELRLNRAVYGLLAEVVAARRGGAVTEASLAGIAGQPRSLTVEVTPAGKRKVIPTGFEQAVPGNLVMFVLMVMLATGGISLVSERRLGILRRLASCPLSRGSIVAAKLGSRLALAIIQTAVGAVVGTALFGVSWGAAPWAAALLLFAYILLCGNLGLWLGSVCRSEGQAAATGVIATLILAALGGCWWPIEVAPLWMQKTALFLPTGLTMDGLHRLISFGEAGGAVAGHIAALLVLAGLVGGLAARAFRFE